MSRWPPARAGRPRRSTAHSCSWRLPLVDRRSNTGREVDHVAVWSGTEQRRRVAHQRDAGNVPNALVLPARQEGFHQGRGGMKLDKCVDQQAARRERETEYGARQALRPATTLPAEVDGRRRYQRPGRVLAGLFLQEKDSTALRGSEFAHLRLPRSIFEVVIETVASHRRLPRSPWRTVERKTAVGA